MRFAFSAALIAMFAIQGCGKAGLPVNPGPAPEGDPPALDRIGSEEAPRFRGPEGRAQFEKAAGMMRKGEYASAIVEFNRLIPLEPRKIAQGEMPDYDSLDHEACVAISECFEKLGNKMRALELAKLARDSHRFYSPAGSTVKAHEMMLAERIARLQAAALQDR